MKTATATTCRHHVCDMCLDTAYDELTLNCVEPPSHNDMVNVCTGFGRDIPDHECENVSADPNDLRCICACN